MHGLAFASLIGDLGSASARS
ncbi:hypothetical protein [Streptomyces sp. ADMS]